MIFSILRRVYISIVPVVLCPLFSWSMSLIHTTPQSITESLYSISSDLYLGFFYLSRSLHCKNSSFNPFSSFSKFPRWLLASFYGDNTPLVEGFFHLFYFFFTDVLSDYSLFLLLVV